MKELFEDRRFRGQSLSVVSRINDIITDYQAQGFCLTLRQLYYQFVARGLCPNTERSYKLLGNVVNAGRLAGLIDWDAIEDRTRVLRDLSHWNSPSEILEQASLQYREDKWKDQPCRVEVWIEKDALRGVIEGACRNLDVPFLACRGYVSQSEMYEAGKRAERRKTIIIYLGDHDPSGIDMSEDVERRISMFARQSVEVRRIALNMKQIKQFNPPPNPAKITDSRYEKYRQEFGEESWELDSLDPGVIRKLVVKEIESIRNDKIWTKSLAKETMRRGTLTFLVNKLKRQEAKEE